MSVALLACGDIQLHDLQSGLSDTELTFKEVNNGREIVDSVRSERYDLVVADFLLADMDGIELQSKVNEISPETSLIFVVDDINNARISDFHEFGNSDIVTGDFSRIELFFRIKRMLCRKKSNCVNLILEHTREVRQAAHQMNNPLTAIIGNAEIMLLKSELSPDVTDMLNSIVSSGEKVARIIESLKNEFVRSAEAVESSSKVNVVIEEMSEFSENRHSVLIVDDEIYITETLSRFLRSQHFNVYTANSGADALAILKENHVDVVVLDMMMPEMDGLDTFINIKDLFVDDPESVPKVLIYTGFVEEERVQHCLNIGAFKVMQKPARAASLCDSIKEALIVQ